VKNCPRNHSKQLCSAVASLKRAKYDKVFVELNSDAGVEPYTVMIESVNTLIASRAVFCAPANIELANCTVDWPSGFISPSQ
jgi:hypothetical protein